MHPSHTVDVGEAPRRYRRLKELSYVTRRLSRPRNDRWIAGVCSGLGRRFGLPSGLVRVLFILSCLLPGPQFVAYLVLWALLPNE